MKGRVQEVPDRRMSKADLEKLGQFRHELRRYLHFWRGGRQAATTCRAGTDAMMAGVAVGRDCAARCV
jgi:hypothetical protein